MPLRNSLQASTAAKWVVLETAEFSGGAAQTHDFTATLAGDTDLGYAMFGVLKNDAASACTYTLRYDDDTPTSGGTVAAAYQSLLASGATVTAAGTSGNLPIGVVAATANADDNHIAFRVMILNPASGGAQRYINVWTTHSNSSVTDVQNQDIWARVTTPTTTPELTGLGFAASVADGIGTVSQVHLAKLVAI